MTNYNTVYRQGNACTSYCHKHSGYYSFVLESDYQQNSLDICDKCFQETMLELNLTRRELEGRFPDGWNNNRIAPLACSVCSSTEAEFDKGWGTCRGCVYRIIRESDTRSIAR